MLYFFSSIVAPTSILSSCLRLSVLAGDDVELKMYEPTLESFIKSWVERLPNKEHLYSVLLQLAEKDRPHFRYWLTLAELFQATRSHYFCFQLQQILFSFFCFYNFYKFFLYIVCRIKFQRILMKDSIRFGVLGAKAFEFWRIDWGNVWAVRMVKW